MNNFIMNNFEKAVLLIEEYRSEADFCEPIKDSAIENAERMLDVVFPHSYRIFLKKYGAGNFKWLEFYGIIKNPVNDAPLVPNGIWLTMEERKSSHLPKNLIIVSSDGQGNYYVINTSEKKIENRPFAYGILP